jgi:hypothetical protein
MAGIAKGRTLFAPVTTPTLLYEDIAKYDDGRTWKDWGEKGKAWLLQLMYV